MAYVPRDKEEKRIADGMTPELQGVIRSEMQEKFASLFNRENGVKKFRQKDQELLIMGFAIRMTDDEVLKAVNKQRREDGINDDIESHSIPYWRRKYQDIIDEVYAVATLRIGEVYSLADKLVRISRYNDLGNMFWKALEGERKAGIITDFTIKKTATFMKILERMNVEMGNKTLDDSIRRKNQPEEREIGNGMSKEDVKKVFKESLEAKYSGQLPVLSLPKKTGVTDYIDCAFGENVGGSVIVCWNETVMAGKCGGACRIQTGDGDICPKFMSRSKLTDREWVEKKIKEGLGVNALGMLARGSAQTFGIVDEESKEKVRSILKQQGIEILDKTKEVLVENKNDNGTTST